MKKIVLVVIILAVSYSTLSSQTIPITVSSTDKDLMSEVRIQSIKFMQLFESLNKFYVDTVNSTKLVEMAIVKMLEDLDPHSVYLTAEEMKESNESFGGSFSGIGIEFNVLRDTLIIVTTVPNGPSQNVGLMPNDRIVAVDGKSMIGIKSGNVHKVLRGPKGSTIEIEVVRPHEKEKLHFLITRDNIPIYTVDASYKLDDKTGYIKVNRFANNTMEEFNKAYKDFGNIDALIVDLRSNGGGLMNQAILMANFFLPNGSAIVSAKGRSIPATHYSARLNPTFPTGKVIILINQSSASASEIVAGAIQDWDRGVIIGCRSFGKGLVQSQLPLIDGSAIRLTVAHYYTPSGRSIQRPFEQGKRDEYYTEASRRNRIDYIDSTKNEGEKYETLRLKREVYSDGGIHPDIYVQSDTTGYSVYWIKLLRQSVITDYVAAYMDTNRGSLNKKYSNFGKFQKSFAITDVMINELVELGQERGIPYDKQGLEQSRPHIEMQIKALIAQKLWTTTEYFRIIYENDEYISKALEVLRNWDSMSGLPH